MNRWRERILWWAAERRLRLDRPYIIAVTGSIGKTSTKQAIGAVLRAAFPKMVRVGFGNLNTYLGVPLAILGFRLDFHEKRVTWQWPFILLRAIWRGIFGRLPKFLVLELGADKPRDIEELTRHIRPDLAVITAIGQAHLMNYRDEEEMAKEKGKLLLALRPGGKAILNEQDKFTPMLKNMTKEKIIYFSSPLANLATAIAREVGVQLEIPPAQLELGLKVSDLPSHRLNRKRINGWEVLDDTYNANPLSMKAALEELKKMPGRKVAILGEMKELGEREAELHRQTGELARQSVNLLIGVGELAKNYQADHWFSDSNGAARGALDYLKQGDSILVKGSRAMKMEKIIESLEKK